MSKAEQQVCMCVCMYASKRQSGYIRQDNFAMTRIGNAGMHGMWACFMSPPHCRSYCGTRGAAPPAHSPIIAAILGWDIRYPSNNPIISTGFSNSQFLTMAFSSGSG